MIERNDLLTALRAPLLYWEGSSPAMISLLLGPAAAKMADFDQRNPHHCYPLFAHCLHTADHIHTSAEQIQTNADLLRVAGLLHDLAKPAVAMEKEGRLVFYGHAGRSAEMAAELLPQLGFDAAESALICFWIGHHDDFISYVLPHEAYDRGNPYLVEITQKNVLKHIRNCSDAALPYPLRNVWNDLLVLCCADASSQSEVVYMNGVQVDSKAHKLSKLHAIREIIDLCL